MAPTTCEQLARVADRLAERDLSPARFLRGLAWNCAGVRPDVRGLIDLARGGRNRFRGAGFRPEYDDGTTGQVRHFAGVAAAPVMLGDGPTRAAVRYALRDPDDSADGRLTETALEFSAGIRSGDIRLAEAGAWIRARVCVG